LDILGWVKVFVDIFDIHELGILILFFFDDPKKNIGLQLLQLDNALKMHILGTSLLQFQHKKQSKNEKNHNQTF